MIDDFYILLDIGIRMFVSFVSFFTGKRSVSTADLFILFLVCCYNGTRLVLKTSDSGNRTGGSNPSHTVFLGVEHDGYAAVSKTVLYRFESCCTCLLGVCQMVRHEILILGITGSNPVRSVVYSRSSMDRAHGYGPWFVVSSNLIESVLDPISIMDDARDF